MLRDIVAMEGELRDDYRQPSVTSVARIRKIHAEVSEEFRKLETLRNSYGALPIPPLPGIKGKIIPLRSQTDLVAEGREQWNCGASFTSFVVEGYCYAYRVLPPSRATLSIRRIYDGNWGIAELEAFCNREVPPATRAFVKEWLEPYRIGA